MSGARRLFLWLLAAVSAAAAIWVLVAAMRAEALSGQVFFAVLPLLMLFSIAWRGLSDKDD